jgi:hypothetical protein
MGFKIRVKHGPREITDPKTKKGLLKAAKKFLKERAECKKDIKKLLYRYYRFYPGDFVDGVAWTKEILSEEEMDTYEKQGVLIISNDRKMVKLGPTGLILISMWNTEKLTRWVIALTIATVLLGVVSVFFEIIKL